MPTWDYNAEKFRELILYVTHCCADDSSFGDTHLNKVLFFSDAFAVQHLGEPITGARYQKLKWGPAARPLLPVRDEMVEEGVVEVAMVGRRRVTRPLRKPATSMFSERQLELVDEVIALMRGKWAATVSDESHLNSPGWNLVEMNEDIPLESQLISRTPPPDRVLARGRELAVKFGW